MKLLRFGPRGAEKPGILDADGNIRDLSGIVGDIAGPMLGDLARLRDLDLSGLPVVDPATRDEVWSRNGSAITAFCRSIPNATARSRINFSKYR